MEMHLPRQALSYGIAALSIIIFYAVGIVLYRLFFSPIAKFPGPKLAAATSWYEIYYDVVKKGKYLFEIEKMHEKYGMYYIFSFNANISPLIVTAQRVRKLM